MNDFEIIREMVDQSLHEPMEASVILAALKRIEESQTVTICHHLDALAQLIRNERASDTMSDCMGRSYVRRADILDHIDQMKRAV